MSKGIVSINVSDKHMELYKKYDVDVRRVLHNLELAFCGILERTKSPHAASMALTFEDMIDVVFDSARALDVISKGNLAESLRKQEKRKEMMENSDKKFGNVKRIED
jgi:hypothetical protein